jgi:hypothetical protein
VLAMRCTFWFQSNDIVTRFRRRATGRNRALRCVSVKTKRPNRCIARSRRSHRPPVAGPLA